MSRTVTLWSSDELRVHRFDHPPEHEDQAYDEVAEAYTASFVEAGTFDLFVDEGRWRLSRGDVFLRHPGLRYQAGFEGEAFSDTCLTLTYVAANDDRFDHTQTWARAARPVLRANNRLLYLRWGLARAVERDEPMLAEYCASEVFRAHGEDERTLFRERKLAWYAERVHAACEHLKAHYEDAHTVSALARAAGMSLFQFTRVFAALVGQPPHQYLCEVRLSAAAKMLREGRAVTETCFACGFNNLSHFSRTFARRYGSSPSRYAL